MRPGRPTAGPGVSGREEMSLAAFLTANGFLAAILLVWNRLRVTGLQANGRQNTDWAAGIGLAWGYGAALAALAALAISLGDGVFFGAADGIPPVAATFALVALSTAVVQAVVSTALSAYRLARGFDPGTPVFPADSEARRGLEWATAVLMPLGLIATLALVVFLQLTE